MSDPKYYEVTLKGTVMCKSHMTLNEATDSLLGAIEYGLGDYGDNGDVALLAGVEVSGGPVKPPYYNEETLAYFHLVAANLNQTAEQLWWACLKTGLANWKTLGIEWRTAQQLVRIAKSTGRWSGAVPEVADAGPNLRPLRSGRTVEFYHTLMADPDAQYPGVGSRDTWEHAQRHVRYLRTVGRELGHWVEPPPPGPDQSYTFFYPEL